MKAYVKYILVLMAASSLTYASELPSKQKRSKRVVAHVDGPLSAAPPRALYRAENSTYADATVDVAFKEMMWKKDNDPVALSFIQTFVPGIQVDSVQFLESAPLAIPALKDRGKKQTFMDFYVKSKDGHHYIVEMQSQRHMRFDERALFYACSVYSRQLEEKHFNDPAWYIHLKPVIAIQVVDYDTNRAKGIKTSDGKGVDPNDQDFVNRVHQSPLPAGQAEKHFVMRDKHSGQELDHLQMIQIELPRCNVSKLPVSGEAISNKDWWMRILKYSDEYTSDELQKAENVPTFVTEAFNRLTFSKWDPVMVQEYKESVVDRGKYSTVLQVERAEGKAEGELRKAHEVVRALMDKKMDDTFIAETTGLLLAEVQALRASF